MVKRLPIFPNLEEAAPRKGFFEHEVFVALREELPERLRAPLTFAYFTGCRRGEILGLEWSQVDRARRVVRSIRARRNREMSGCCHWVRGSLHVRGCSASMESASRISGELGRRRPSGRLHGNNRRCHPFGPTISLLSCSTSSAHRCPQPGKGRSAGARCDADRRLEDTKRVRQVQYCE